MQCDSVYIGPVPIVIRPYVRLDAKINTIPINVYAGIKCRYAENVAVGYYYDKKQGKSYPIHERKILSKACTKQLEMTDFESKGIECPDAELGMLFYVISVIIFD